VLEYSVQVTSVLAIGLNKYLGLFWLFSMSFTDMLGSAGL